MIDSLAPVLRLNASCAVVVTEPEPQKPGGGPYPDGGQCDRAMTGLRRTLRKAGFQPWERRARHVAARVSPLPVKRVLTYLLLSANQRPGEIRT